MNRRKDKTLTGTVRKIGRKKRKRKEEKAIEIKALLGVGLPVGWMKGIRGP
jgi:hypothetical protein